ncbi:MAG: glycosyltransferase N-terminal domain-containing protein [Pseudotabrizicola sp.]|uniref:3-deoxy-D-manno-octulosonic acid transferase n=1 Tax=Pseudotabrizicola sp. TaxID=2939647 RepID=UPI00271B04A1|nr:glycosyltransferase N-terminal domain-containing protein [Pseudotabrizicola sp.]MDO8884946.1 glycosyltransferase N-terminal domain-containing protein [Pseudotabrizicola sp.]MDZ7573702.1 glycosyltransferase N-terminal domain-containing protein [Pseudotabrizicola sp.]
MRAYLAASPLIALAGPVILRRRLARGKEDPARMDEKRGYASAPRPEGRLIWLHAVGLGEVLALRGLISAMAQHDPALQFLITSSARSSAQVIGANLPPRTQHQYLPLDAPTYLARFLDHWRPDLSVWAEQELWPGAVVAAHARGIPLALVNARMTDAGFNRRVRAGGLYGDLLARFARITAQDTRSADHLTALGASGVQVTGSLKSAAPPLAADPATLAQAQAAVQGRKVWVAASTHAGDEAQAVAAQAALWQVDPQWLLILAPRDAGRAGVVASQLTEARLPFARRSLGRVPSAGDAVWLADTYGEMGLWYRLASAALIGGGFDAVGGHNPWEAAHFNAAILHGPDTANFLNDYKALHDEVAAVSVPFGKLAEALQDTDLPDIGLRAGQIVHRAAGALDPLAAELLALVRR